MFTSNSHFKILLFVLFALVSSESQAQFFDGFYGRGSTIHGDHLRGQGAFFHGYGTYLRDRGVYEFYHEQTRKQYIQNWQLYVETRRHLKDQNEERKLAENIERRANLQRYLKKKRLENPVLDPKIGWNDKWYSSLQELQKDPDYQQFLFEKHEKQLVE